MLVAADDRGLDEAARVLNAGGVAVIPTDTVYGLAAHPAFPDAVARLYTIKGRAARKPIALLAADSEAVRAFGSAVPDRLARLWPGALTVVVGPEGFRVPDHAWTRALLRRCGGVLRVTSANLSGRRAATDAPQALADVGLSADLVVDDGVSPGGAPSTVVRVRDDGTCETLRAGAVTVADAWSSARAALRGDLLSVILPVYRLAVSVEANLDAVMACFDAAGLPYELVPVDDGSGDGTAEALRRVAARRPDVVRPVLLEANAGKGNALRVGFRASRGGFVLLLDGDLDIAPKMLPKFFDALVRDGCDIVVGSKRHPASSVQYPWHRRLASAVYFALVRLFIGLPVTDTQTGMKLFRRRPLGEALARMLVKTYAFDLELLAIARERRAKIGEAPVEIRFGAKFGALKLRTVREMVHDTLAVFYRLRLLHYYAKVEVPPPLAAPPLVSVVIACPAGSWMLDECLAALARQTYRAFEVIVLPDAAIAPFAPALGGARRLVQIPTGKVRPAEKRNRGIAAAKGEVVAFIDDDAYPEANWIENAVKYFGNPEIGAVGGPGVTPPGDGFLARAGGRVYENVFVGGAYRYRYVGGRVRRDVDDYPSCNLFVRTALLRACGGYRTDFWPGEDTLLCRAIVCEAKKRIVYDPWTLVYHHRRPLFGPHLRQLGRYAFHRGYFAKRFPENSRHLAYFAPTLFALYALALALAWASLPLWPATKGAWLTAVLGLWLFTAPMGLYAVLTALSAWALNPFLWGATWLGVVASHLWYGVRFAQGLCARRAPCEYIGRDHAVRA